MAVTPLKRIRVDDSLWVEFGDAAEAIGLDRTKVIVGFMRRFVDAMDGRMVEGDHGRSRPHSAT